MEGSFAEKIKTILSETGYARNVDDTDFDWIENSNDKEIIEFKKWFTDYISSDNLISCDERMVVGKLKDEALFIESEEEVDNVLQQMGTNVEGQFITEKNIDCIKDEITEVEKNIRIMKKLKKQIKSELERVNENLVDLKKQLKKEDTKLHDAVSECFYYNEKFNALLEEINNKYKEFKNNLEDNFLDKKLNKDYLIFTSSRVFDVQHANFKKKIKMYINSCRHYSSIPVSSNSSVISSCDSTFCSSASSGIGTDPLYSELTRISVCLNQQMFDKFMNEMKEQMLRCQLKNLQEMNENIEILWSEIEEQTLKPVHEEEIDEKDETDDGDQLELRLECSKWVDNQINLVLINLIDNKTSRRQQKLDVLKRFENMLQRHITIFDLRWMLNMMEYEFLEDIPYNHIINNLMDNLKQYRNRMECMKNIVAENCDKRPQVQSYITCINKMLSPSQNDLDLNRINGAITEFTNSIGCKEDLMLQSFKNIEHILNERYQMCVTSKKNVFDGPTDKLTIIGNRITSIIRNIKNEIDIINNKINSGSLKYNELQQYLSCNPKIGQLYFLWVTLLMEPEKLI